LGNYAFVAVGGSGVYAFSINNGQTWTTVQSWPGDVQSSTFVTPILGIIRSGNYFIATSLGGMMARGTFVR
jgi:hypothetical protein